MSTTSSTQQIKTDKKQINYINRSFDDIMMDIGNYSKQYFPAFFQKFNSEDYSIEKLLSELIAYQSDILNFNIDDRFAESYLQYATEKESIWRNAKRLGYKPELAKLAVGEVTFTQLVPLKMVDDEQVPNLDYAGIIDANSVVSNISNAITYTTIEKCDMRFYDTAVIQGSNFILAKKCKIRSGRNKIKEVSVESDPMSYRRVYVDKNVAMIQSVIDSQGNRWYQVPYLAQDYIFENGIDIENETETEFNNVLKIKRVSRRFEVDYQSDGSCFLLFGSGRDVIDDTLKELSANDILSTNELVNMNISSNIIGDNFSNSDSYGLSPYNTRLSISYVVSDGQESNVKPNNITRITNLNIIQPSIGTLSNQSFLVNNEESVNGSEVVTDFDKIRMNASQSYSSQNRCVNENDYAIRVKLLPSRYGSISKSFVQKSRSIYSDNQDTNIYNTNSLDIYVLSVDSEGYLEYSNTLTKRNLVKYLQNYRTIGTRINIIDPFIINFKIEFSFSYRKNYIREEVLKDLFSVVEEYFKVSRWEINQPIMVEELKYNMFDVEGVLSISDLKFTCLTDSESGYNPNFYEMEIENGVIYPPKDIGIFELKYPKKNIKATNV